MAHIRPNPPGHVDAAISWLAGSWAYAENVLESCNRLLHEEFDGNLIEPEVPRSFRRKLHYFRRCFDSDPRLASYKDEANTVADDLGRYADIRHWCAHGIREPTRNETYTEKVKFVRFRRGSKLETESRSFSARQINTASLEVLRIGIRLAALQACALCGMPNEELVKLFRKLARKYS
jgi:hypothetical protein